MCVFGQVMHVRLDFAVYWMNGRVVGMAQRKDTKLDAALLQCPYFLGNEGFGQTRVSLDDDC